MTKVNSITIDTNCFANNKFINSIDCKNAKWTSNNMTGSFFGCSNLTYASNINNNVTNMVSSFRNCTNLTSVPTIPNSVTNMSATFINCTSLVDAPVISNGITDMGGAFQRCYSLVNAPVIPESVINMKASFYFCNSLINAPDMSNAIYVSDMNGIFSECSKLNNITEIPLGVVNLSGAFKNCYSLVNAPDLSKANKITDLSTTFINCYSLVNVPVIPNSVTNMVSTFTFCNSLVNVPDIPNNVVSMNQTFFNCTSLVNAPTIPNSVTNMYKTFYSCTGLAGDITIQSENITSVMNCFDRTTLTKNVYIPFKYENGVNTATYNSFIAAGYTNSGSKCGVYLKDINTPQECTLTINPTPSDAEIMIVKDGIISYSNTITVDAGTTISYMVSKSGYNSYVSYKEVINQDEEKDVILELDESFTPGPITVNGNLTVENETIYSGFDNVNGNYLVLPSDYCSSDNTIVMKFMMTGTASSEYRQMTFMPANFLDMYIWNGSTMISKYPTPTPYVSSGGHSDGLIVCELNKWYWFKLKLSLPTVIMQFSEDGIVWGEEFSGYTYGSIPSDGLIIGADTNRTSNIGFIGKFDTSGFRVYNSNGDSIWGSQQSSGNKTLYVEKLPLNASITLTAESGTQVNDTITVPSNTDVNCSISEASEGTQSITIKVVDNLLTVIDLGEIKALKDYTVTKNKRTATIGKYNGLDINVVVPTIEE